MTLAPERILILKPSSLGDIVHTLPVLASLRVRFPHSHIAWLIKEEWAEILQDNPDLDEVITSSFRPTHWPSLIQRIRQGKFDLAIDLQGLFRTGILARLSGARERVGFAAGREGSPWFYTHRVELPVKIDRAWRLLSMHAVDRNLAVAAYLGADISTPTFRLPDRESDQRVIQDMLKAAGVQPGDRLISMAPVSREELKNWPLERYIAVADELCRGTNHKILLLGSSEQRWLVERFSRLRHDCCIDMVGKLRIRQIGSVLRHVDLLIANDSAPIHLAAAVGVPVLGLFGPTHVDATGPYGSVPHRVLHTVMPCRPCGKKRCAYAITKECLLRLSVEEVVSMAQSMLGDSSVMSPKNDFHQTTS